MRILVVALIALFGPLIAAAAPPPVTAFTGYSRYESLQISPQGDYLALTRRSDEYESLMVLHYPDLKPSTQNHFGAYTDIDSVIWANDTRLLIQPAQRFPGYAYKAPTGEIMGINADGKRFDILFGYNAGKMQTNTHITQREATFSPAAFLDRIPGDPGNVLIQTYGYSREGEINSVYRMNVMTGKLDKVASSPIRDGSFVTDFDHHVALVYGEDREGNSQMFDLLPANHDWHRVTNTSMMEGAMWPLGHAGAAGQFLVLDNRDSSTDGVFVWSPADGSQKLLYRNPEVDLEPMRPDPSNGTWGFTYSDHFQRYWYPDPNHPLAKLHQMLRAEFKGQSVWFTSASDDLSLAVAMVSSPRNPPAYLIVDVKSGKVQQQLRAYPDLKFEDLSAVDPIEFKARDGLAIRGYLTVPNVPKPKQLPLIVLVHGGPHGIFDTYEFNPEAQLFASRGYAVLQVNFRGSGGRGRVFEGAGFGKWGREMQDDITDGVKWAISDGVADPQRICIYGASYGAYAALTGAFREPDLFKCAVGFAGIYDLPLMFEKGDVQTLKKGMNYLKEVLGTDTEELKRRSPVYNAEKIHAAVMLVHGTIDQRAPFEHALRMRAALTKAGHPPEWFTEYGEGHGFFNEKNLAEAYERMLAFFDKHIGAAVTAKN